MPDALPLSPDQLHRWASVAQAQAPQGQVNSRILRLATSNPLWLAVQVAWGTSPPLSWGDCDRIFPLMSVVKPFLLLYLLEQYGPSVFEWVGTTPSAQPFNSLEQLIADGGQPRNPMINSGAIALAAHLPGDSGAERCDRLCQWLNAIAGCTLALDEAMLASVHQAGREPNLALLAYLVERGQVQQPQPTLEAYERACCLSGTVSDLACLGQLLAFESAIAWQHRCTVNALMLTCGLYEASATCTVQVGLPMKSGISGALLAVVPGRGAIATYSPALDAAGNPIAGLALVKQLAQGLKLSLFG